MKNFYLAIFYKTTRCKQGKTHESKIVSKKKRFPLVRTDLLALRSGSSWNAPLVWSDAGLDVLRIKDFRGHAKPGTSYLLLHGLSYYQIRKKSAYITPGSVCLLPIT